MTEEQKQGVCHVMELNFAGLKAIAEENRAVNSSEATGLILTGETGFDKGNVWQCSFKGFTGENTKPKKEEATQIEASAYVGLKKQQESYEKMQKVYKEYQDNMKRAGELRTDIMKMAKRGEPAEAILLKAVECISCMTGDRILYTQIEKDMRAIYGEALLQQVPLEMELENVQQRLDNLRDAYIRDGVSLENRQSIGTAIREHEKKVAALKDLLQQHIIDKVV